MEDKKYQIDFTQEPIKLNVKSGSDILEWYVAPDFIKNNSHLNLNSVNLLDALKVGLIEHTHNNNGPAVKNLTSGAESFWSEGKPKKEK